MWEIEKNFKVRLGGNYFINCDSLISYNDRPLFTLKRRDSDGRLGIDFDVYDNRCKKVATIRGGKVVDGDKSAYQISHGADCHEVIEKSTGRVIVKIDKKLSGVELDVTANMYLPDGFLLEITPNSINIGTVKMINNIFDGCRVGIVIGECLGGAIVVPLPKQ